MFEFFRSRDTSVRYLLTAMLIMVALSMVTYLIPGGPGSGSSGATEQQVAVICGETVTLREVAAGIQNAMRNKQFPPEMVQNYIPEYVNQMITERAMACQSGNMGFKISDEDLAETIRGMLPNLFPGGQVNVDVYTQFLQQQGLTVAEFEKNVRKQMLLTRLRNVAMEGVIVTPQEVEAEYRRRKESAKLDYFSFNEDKFRAQATVSSEEVQAYFAKNRLLFKQPERRSFDMLVFDQGRFAATYQVTEGEVLQAYNQSKDSRFRTPERLHIRHILLKTADKKPEEATAIENKAKDLLKQIKGGADFAELAKKNSEDPGSAVKGGDLDFISRGQTVKNFENTAFALKPNEISGVIKTEYGFHILQLLEKQEARLRPFEEVKAQLLEERKKQGVVEKLQSTADQLRAALLKTPGDAAQLAQKSGANYYQVKDALPGDPLQEIGMNKEMGDSVTALQKGGVTGIVTAPGNKLAIATLTGITPSRPSELNEVEAQIRTTLTTDKARQLAQEKTKEVQNQVGSAGGDLRKLAALAGADVKSTPDFQREGAVEGLGSANYFADAFSKPIGTIIGPVSVMGQTIVAKITGQTPADLGGLAAEREAIVTALKSKKARTRQDLFEDGLVSELTRQGKVKIYKDVIDRLRKDFRG